jgi:hypothetical protein
MEERDTVFYYSVQCMFPAGMEDEEHDGILDLLEDEEVMIELETLVEKFIQKKTKKNIIVTIEMT